MIDPFEHIGRFMPEPNVLFDRKQVALRRRSAASTGWAKFPRIAILRENLNLAGRVGDPLCELD